MGAPDLLASALRALGFVAAIQAAGTALFQALFGNELKASAPAVAKLGKAAAAGGLFLTVAYHVVQPARLAGAFSGIFDSGLQALVLASDAGASAATRMLGLALVIFACAKRDRARDMVGVIGATLVAMSFVLMGHTATHDQRWLLVALLGVHVLIVAFWFGALLPLHFASSREALGTNAALIERFSAAAVWLVPLIMVAGIAMSVLLLPNLASVATPYGALLLAKVGGFAALMALAAANKWRWGPLIEAQQAGALVAFRRSVLGEWVLIAAVLSVTAAMTTLFSPGH